MINRVRNAIKGALYGVAVGDALGAPLEFMSAEKIKNEHGYVTEMIGGGWLNTEPGEITDDTQMTLAVAEGIVANPNEPVEEVGARFIKWENSGPKDIGGTCSSSIRGARSKAEEEKSKTADRPTFARWKDASMNTAVKNGKHSGGNGALMRTVFPGLFYRDSREAVQKASDIGRMTHWDDESDEACKLYTRIVHSFIEIERTSADGADEAKKKEKKDTAFRRILKGTIYDTQKLKGEQDKLKPSGYVVDSMKCAVYFFLQAESFEKAVADAANFGGDADTIAAITGGLAGAYCGYEAIPTRWLEALAPDVRVRLDELADAAVERRTAESGNTHQ